MQRNLATKIRAKWESGLTTVRLKRDPLVCSKYIFPDPGLIIYYFDHFIM